MIGSGEQASFSSREYNQRMPGRWNATIRAVSLTPETLFNSRGPTQAASISTSPTLPLLASKELSEDLTAKSDVVHVYVRIMI